MLDTLNSLMKSNNVYVFIDTSWIINFVQFDLLQDIIVEPPGKPSCTDDSPFKKLKGYGYYPDSIKPFNYNEIINHFEGTDIIKRLERNFKFFFDNLKKKTSANSTNVYFYFIEPIEQELTVIKDNEKRDLFTRVSAHFALALIEKSKNEGFYAKWTEGILDASGDANFIYIASKFSFNASLVFLTNDYALGYKLYKLYNFLQHDASDKSTLLKKIYVFGFFEKNGSKDNNSLISPDNCFVQTVKKAHSLILSKEELTGWVDKGEGVTNTQKTYYDSNFSGEDNIFNIISNLLDKSSAPATILTSTMVPPTTAKGSEPLDSNIKHLKIELKKKQELLKIRGKTYQKLKEEKESLETKYQELEKELEKTTKELAQLKDSGKEKEDIEKDLKEEKKTLEEERESLNERIQGLERVKKELEKDLKKSKDLEKEKKTLEEERETLEKSKKDLEKDFDEMVSTLETKIKELEETQKISISKDEAVKDLQEKIKELQATNGVSDPSTKQIDELQTKLKEQKEQYDHKIKILKVTLDDSSKKVEEHKASKTEEIEKLKKKLEEIRKSAEENQEKLLEEKERLSTEYEEEKKRLVKEKKQIQTLLDDKLIEVNKIVDRDTENEELKKQLSAANKLLQEHDAKKQAESSKDETFVVLEDLPDGPRVDFSPDKENNTTRSDSNWKSNIFITLLILGVSYWNFMKSGIVSVVFLYITILCLYVIPVFIFKNSKSKTGFFAHIIPALFIFGGAYWIYGRGGIIKTILFVSSALLILWFNNKPRS